MRKTPKLLKFVLNLYGPFLGAGIRIERISDDWKSVDVSMAMRWYNRNVVGAHFGGSLYSMVDPQYMLMLMNCLGRDYIVWDKTAHIDFISPGRGKVRAQFRITDEQLDEIRLRTANGDKYLPEFNVEVLDEHGDLVARAVKTLYVRRKLEARS